MSQENVETIREMFALVNERGVRAATDVLGHLLAPDFAIEEAAGLPDPEAYTGRDAFLDNLAKLEASFAELRMEPLEIIDLGDQLVVVVSMRGQGHGSGAPVEMTFAQLWSLRDGKAVSLHDFATKADALDAAGPPENVEVVRRVYEAVARHDAETVLSLYDPDIVWDFSRSPVGEVMGRQVYRGHEGLREWWVDWSEAWENYVDDYSELIDAGEHVISVVSSRGRGRVSGADIGWRQYGVWTIREGKVLRVLWFSTRHDALEAAGLAQ